MYKNISNVKIIAIGILWCYLVCTGSTTKVQNAISTHSRLGIVRIAKSTHTLWPVRYLGAPSFSADGQKIVIHSLGSHFSGSQKKIAEKKHAVIMVDLKERNAQTLVSSDTANFLYPQFSPTDSIIAIITDKSHSISLIDVKRQSMKKLVSVSPPYYNIKYFAWSPDGTKIAYVMGDAVCLVDVSTKVSRKLIHFELSTIDNKWYNIIHPHIVWSPTSDILLVTCGDYGTEPSDVWIVDFSGRCRRIIEDSYYPSFSPDGKRIAFTRNGSSGCAIYVVQSNGTGMKKLTDGWSPSWSPDGKHIAFYKIGYHRTFELWLINTATMEQIQVKTPFIRYEIAHPHLSYYFYAYPATWSPLGDRIAYIIRGNQQNLAVAELTYDVKAEITLETSGGLFHRGIRIWEREDNVEITVEITCASPQLVTGSREISPPKVATISFEEYKEVLACIEEMKAWELKSVDKNLIFDAAISILSIGMYKNSQWKQHSFQVYAVDRFREDVTAQERIVLIIEQLAKKYVQ